MVRHGLLVDRTVAGLLPIVCCFAPELMASPLYTPLLVGAAALFSWWPTTYWQLLPAQAGWWLVAFGMPICGSFLGALSILALVLIPLPDVAGVEGPFGVGVVDYASGSDPAVIGRLFYPTHAHSKVAPYIAYGNRHGLTRKFIQYAAPAPIQPYLPSNILRHWSSVRIRAAEGAPLLPTAELQAGGSALPVVVFSHGLTATRETSSSLALSLAARGAVVALVEHSDRSATLSRSSSGPALEFDASVTLLGHDPATDAYRNARRAQTEIRVANMLATIRWLAAVNEHGIAPTDLHPAGSEPAASTQLELRRRLDFQRLILGGHSFGGCTALATAAHILQQPARQAADSPPLPAALFCLDPAVDWVPSMYWSTIGYDGIFKDSKRPGGKAAGVDKSPQVARTLPILNVFSEQWAVNFGWYQHWAEHLSLTPDAKLPCASLTIAGLAHQGLCDLALTLPHWLGQFLQITVMRTSRGVSAASMGSATNEAVLAFLSHAHLLPTSFPAELGSVPLTSGLRLREKKRV